MSSSQLTFTPSFFRGIQTTNQITSNRYLLWLVGTFEYLQHLFAIDPIDLPRQPSGASLACDPCPKGTLPASAELIALFRGDVDSGMGSIGIFKTLKYGLIQKKQWREKPKKIKKHWMMLSLVNQKIQEAYPNVQLSIYFFARSVYCTFHAWCKRDFPASAIWSGDSHMPLQKAERVARRGA